MERPPPGFSRETRIRRDRYGQWFDGEEPVTNPAVAAAFDRWVDRAPDGRYCLRNSVNWVYVDIEGTPIFVRHVRIREDGLELHLSDARTELLDPATLSLEEEGILVCAVRGGTMPALFTTPAMMELEPIVGEDGEGIFLTIAGVSHRPGPAPASAASPPPPRS